MSYDQRQLAFGKATDPNQIHHVMVYNMFCLFCWQSSSSMDATCSALLVLSRGNQICSRESEYFLVSSTLLIVAAFVDMPVQVVARRPPQRPKLLRQISTQCVLFAGRRWWDLPELVFHGLWDSTPDLDVLVNLFHGGWRVPGKGEAGLRGEGSISRALTNREIQTSEQPWKNYRRNNKSVCCQREQSTANQMNGRDKTLLQAAYMLNPEAD